MWCGRVTLAQNVAPYRTRVDVKGVTQTSWWSESGGTSFAIFRSFPPPLGPNMCELSGGGARGQGYSCHQNPQGLSYGQQEVFRDLHEHLKLEKRLVKSVDFSGMTTIRGFSCRSKLHLLEFYRSSSLVNFEMQICITDKWQTVLTALTFEGTRDVESPKWRKLLYPLSCVSEHKLLTKYSYQFITWIDATRRSFWHHRYVDEDAALHAAAHWTDVSTRPPYWYSEAVPPNARMSVKEGRISTIKIIIACLWHIYVTRYLVKLKMWGFIPKYFIFCR